MFDPAEARRAAEEFSETLDFLKGEDPAMMAVLQDAWNNAYKRCGHKILGRMILGQTVDQAVRIKEF